MDTRAKILRWESAQLLITPSDDVQVVTGYFDPLLALHAARLRALAKDCRRLVVVVTDPPDPLLPARARAELVAALAAVDHVILAPAETPLVFPEGLRLIRDESRDAAATRELIRQVHRRHRTHQTVGDG